MKVGIIGIGNIGGTLARKLKALGHDVRVANSKGAYAVKGYADEIGATAVDVCGAVRGVDLVIIAIPFHAAASLPKGLFEGVPDSVPVVDTSNYYPGMLSPPIPEVDAGMVQGVWASRQLARPTIKAFNNILSPSLADFGRPAGAADRIAIAVAGDDAAAKRTVMEIVDDLGFDPVDAGSLQESWRQEPSTPAYCCDYNAEETRRGLAAAVRGEAPKKMARLPELWGKLGASPTHGEIIDANRAFNAPD